MDSVQQDMPPDLRLEFQISDIGQRIEVPDLTENLYVDLVQKVEEKDIIGVQVVPQRWPRKVQILCAHQTAKECLMIRGLDIYGRHIELDEPGQGVLKIVIQDAPLDMPNDIIKDWVAKFGTVTEFRNEHVMVHGRKTNWRTGNRHAFVRRLQHPVPPTAKIKYGDNEVPVTVWHYGQTEMKCRHCHKIVPKQHTCDKLPARKCFNCGSEAHTKVNCTVGKACFRCGDKTHFARDCQQTGQRAGFYPDFNLGEHNFPGLPVKPKSETQSNSEGSHTVTHSNHETERNVGIENVLNDTKEDSVLIDDDSGNIHDHKLNVVLIGGSNCRHMLLESDDQLQIETTSLIEGGLKIKNAAEKLEELNAEQKKDIGTVVIHVGACDFPAKDDNVVDTHYREYVELMNGVVTAVPHANILVSSVLPRAGAGKEKEKMNMQIEAFNAMVENLAFNSMIENVNFCDNSVHFKSEQGVIPALYGDVETFGLHINNEGKKRLAASIVDKMKEIYFSQKLVESAKVS